MAKPSNSLLPAILTGLGFRMTYVPDDAFYEELGHSIRRVSATQANRRLVAATQRGEYTRKEAFLEFCKLLKKDRQEAASRVV